MYGRTFNSVMVIASALIFSMAALAQVKIGDEIGLGANGTVSGGYSGSYGSEVQSGHGFTFGGNANVNGYYYSPNFLSFTANPYFNESRSNSSFQSITDSTGVQLTSNIFAGSHFPGAVSYTRSFNKSGTFAIPGQADLVTNGDNQSINIVWSETLPDVPSVTAGFTKGNSSYDVFGSDSQGSSNFNNLFIHSYYRLLGFNVGGGYSQGAGHSTIPQVFTGLTSEEANSNDKNFNISASHLLPLNGGASASFSRNYLNNDYLGYKFNGTIDTVNMSAGLNPTQKLNLGMTANYTDNFYGQLYRAIIPPAGGADLTSAPNPGVPSVTAGYNTSTGSSAWQFSGSASYTLSDYMIANGEVVRRQQEFGGITFASELFGGGLLYSRPLIGGYISTSGFVSDNKIENTGDNFLSFSGNGSYTRKFGRWNTSVTGGYSQNVQSALINFTTSNYSVSGNTARRIGPFFWTASAGTSQSVLTAQPHTHSSSQSYSTGIGYRDLSLQGNYTKSDGNGLATGIGLAPGPLPPVIPPELLILYGSTGYGVALSGSPVKRLTFSAAWNRSRSNTLSQGIFSLNHLEQETLYVQYQFRKVGVQGGYTRLVQGFSVVSGRPADFSTFSITLYRWFNFF